METSSGGKKCHRTGERKFLINIKPCFLFRKKNAKVKSGYKREHINVGCDMDFDIAGPSIRGAFVVGYEGWLAGYQMTFETAKSRITQSNFAVGYKTDEFQLHTNV